MQRIQQAQPVDYALLTHRIRERLRGCRCLIFAYRSRSHVSRWMLWELGFFDGRWDGRLIGLYDLDEGAGDETAEPAQQGPISRASCCCVSNQAGDKMLANIYAEF
jgi:hypothetical protein